MSRCDRERLMLPMLGIYDERGAWARCREPRSPGPRPRTLEALEPARDALFPKTFEYVSVEGGTRTTETRPLFGDLVEAVQWYSEDPDRLHDGASQHSTSRCILRRLKGRQCSGASKAFEPGTRAQRRATMGEKAHLSASTGSTFISPSLRSRSTRSVSLSLETTLPLGIATVPHSP